MIIGRDLQSALKMDILFSTGSFTWNGITIPMRNGQQKSKEELDAFLESIIETSSEPKIIREELYEAIRIRNSDYKKADLDQLVKDVLHLTEEQKSQVRSSHYAVPV